MVQSLDNRLSTVEPEVLEYTRLHGQHRAMERYGVRDYVAFTGWLTRHAGTADYGISPLLGKSRSGNLGTDLLDAFLHKVHQLEAQLAQERARTEDLQAQLEAYQCQAAQELEPKIAEVMRLCATEKLRLQGG